MTAPLDDVTIRRDMRPRAGAAAPYIRLAASLLATHPPGRQHGCDAAHDGGWRLRSGGIDQLSALIDYRWVGRPKPEPPSAQRIQIAEDLPSPPELRARARVRRQVDMFMLVRVCLFY